VLTARQLDPERRYADARRRHVVPTATDGANATRSGRLVVVLAACCSWVVAMLLAPGSASASPFGFQAHLRAVSGTGTGLVLGAPTAADGGTFAAQLTVAVHGVIPDTTYVVSRAVDLVPDGVCTMASGWLLNGPLVTSHAGSGAAHFVVHRGPPFVSGARFDVAFRVAGPGGSELRTACETVTVK